MSINRSAFESIPGRDALLEYEAKNYPEKTYVEKDGLVYKSLTATSNTFLSPQWELIADLREVRVPNIGSRNALTGNTPTTGTTGIRIPILDNTNILVLNAVADPQVGVNNFARYNYNQTLGTWLLLQVGTGATSSNVNDYTLLINKPSVVSGVTVNAGAGMTGGGSIFGTSSAPYAAGGSVTLTHADTSAQADIVGAGYAYVQTLRFDTFGHVTGATNNTWVHPDTSTQASVSNTGKTYIQSISVDGDGHVTTIASSTWFHPDTSSQASSSNAGNTFIQSIFLDGDGHVTGINTGVAAGGGGGGSSPLKYNADFGGVLTMNTGATLTISGGTNIQTFRTGNAATPGLRIAVNPAGTTTQLQFNNAGALGASANLTFTGGTALVTNRLAISGVPLSGSTADQILTRNATGVIQRIGIGSIVNYITPLFSANNGLTKNGNNFRLGGALTGNTIISGAGIDMFFTNRSWTFGTRSGSTGANSFTSGSLNTAQGANSHAEGGLSVASGQESHAQNRYTKATGTGSHAGGQGQSNDNTKFVLASGIASFNHSQNDSSQTSGHGANAVASAILGGINHDIDASNTNAVILGGNSIKLSASTYIDHVAVPNLAIMTAPTAGIGSDDVLVRSSTTGRIRTVTQASLAGGGGGTPAGVNTQVQFNNGGLFGASPNFTFNSGTNTLNSTNMIIGGVPAVGFVGDNILIRNTGTGAIETIATSTIGTANNGVTKSGNVYVLGGSLTNDTTIAGPYLLTFSAGSLTIGSRSGVTGANSFAMGLNTLASGAFSFSQGQLTKSSGSNSHAQGFRTTATANASHAEGSITTASGIASHAEGSDTAATSQYSPAERLHTIASAQSSLAGGENTTASGIASHAGGRGNNAITKRIIASGLASFNHSHNSSLQIDGHGALADYSVILGGRENNIEVGNINAAIIGGYNVKLTGTTYLSTTAVLNFAIMGGLASGIAADDVLVRRSTTGKIFGVTQASIGGVAVNGLTKVGSNVRLGGSLTGNTTITGGAGLFFANGFVTVGSRSGATGTNSFTVGINNLASGNYSVAIGQQNKATDFNAVAQGLLTTASGGNSHAEGQNTLASGSQSHAEGWDTIASGLATHAEGSSNSAIGHFSHAQGQGTISQGQYSHAGGKADSVGKYIFANGTASFIHSYNSAAQIAGHGALADYSAILGGQNHNIEATNTRAVIIGGFNIKLTGTSYVDHTAVANLAIMTAPSVGLSSDDVLVRRSPNGKILSVTQASLVGAGNGLNKLGNTVRLGGALTGDTTIGTLNQFNLIFKNRSVTVGLRSAGVVGLNSFAVGSSTGTGVASGTSSVAIAGGLAVGNGAIAAHTSKAFGDNSFAVGFQNESHGTHSFSAGNNNRAIGGYSFAVGVGTQTDGVGAFASGTIQSIGVTRLLAAGQASFNHSYNSFSQVAGHGALAPYSAILGGSDNNIEAGNTGAAIIGGNSVKLTGSTYIYTAAVSKLAIRQTPIAGINTDNVLVRRATTGIIMAVTQASISDERLKKNIQPLTGVLANIDSLITAEFQYNEVNQPELRDKYDYGLIAQQVEKVYPFVVNDNLKIEGDDTTYKTIEYRKLVPVLFAAIKELNEKIKVLESKIN